MPDPTPGRLSRRDFFKVSGRGALGFLAAAVTACMPADDALQPLRPTVPTAGAPATPGTISGASPLLPAVGGGEPVGTEAVATIDAASTQVAETATTAADKPVNQAAPVKTLSSGPNEEATDQAQLLKEKQTAAAARNSATPPQQPTQTEPSPLPPTDTPPATATNEPPPPTATVKKETRKPPALVRPAILPEEKWSAMNEYQQKKAMAVERWFRGVKFDGFSQTEVNEMHGFFVLYGAYMDAPGYDFYARHPGGKPLPLKENNFIAQLPKYMTYIKSNLGRGTFNTLNPTSPRDQAYLDGMLLDMNYAENLGIDSSSPSPAKFASAWSTVQKEFLLNYSRADKDNIRHFDALTHAGGSIALDAILDPESGLAEIDPYRNQLIALNAHFEAQYKGAP